MNFKDNGQAEPAFMRSVSGLVRARRISDLVPTRRISGLVPTRRVGTYVYPRCGGFPASDANVAFETRRVTDCVPTQRVVTRNG